MWSVRPESPQQSLLTTEAEIELEGGPLGKLLEPVMSAVFRRMAPNALTAFKYLVKNGQPYDGRHSEMPRAPAIC